MLSKSDVSLLIFCLDDLSIDLLLITQLCPTLCNPMDCSLSMEFSRQECWYGLPFPSPGHLPNPGIEPGSPALQADSLPTALQEKPT